MTINLRAAIDSDDSATELPIPADPFDLAPVRARLEPYRIQIEEMASQAQAHKVTDDVTLRAAVEMGNQAKTLGKSIDLARKSILEEPEKYVKAVRSLAKSFTDNLGFVEANLKEKIGRYQYQRQMEERKRQEEARKAAEELQARLDAEAKKANVEPVKVAAPVVPAAPRVTRTEAGSAHIRTKWEGAVVDPSKVPREYCEPSQRLINEAVKAGVREIPGVVVEEKPITVFRG